jgi:hypothetical protein
MEKKKQYYSKQVRDYIIKNLDYDPDTGILRVKSELPPSHWKEIGKPSAMVAYGRVSILGHPMPVHRVIWYHVHHKWPREIDHINRVRGDNRLCNLRNVSHRENMQNTPRADRHREDLGLPPMDGMEKDPLVAVYVDADGRMVRKGRDGRMVEVTDAEKAAMIGHWLPR